MTIGVRTSAQFEALWSQSVGDRNLDKTEYTKLETEFKKVNPEGNFHEYLRERLESKVDPRALAMMSLGSSRPVELLFPPPNERLRLTGSADVNLNLTDRNGLATEGRNDISGNISGRMQLSGVADVAGLKFDIQDLQNLGFQADEQGRLAVDMGTVGSWLEWGVNSLGDTRNKIQQGLRSMGIEAEVRVEGTRMILDPRSMKMTGEQLRGLGISNGIPARGEVEVDLRQARFSVNNGQLGLEFNRAGITGSSDTASTVDASQAPGSQAENLNLSIAGTGNYTTTATPDGQAAASLQARDVEARVSMDVRSLQGLQQRLNSEDPQNGALHGQMRALGLSEETISTIKTGSQAALARLMRDPGSRIELALKAQTVGTSAESFEQTTPELLTILQSRLKSEDPASGQTQAQLRAAGVSDEYLQELRNASPDTLRSLLEPPRSVTRERFNFLMAERDKIDTALAEGQLPVNQRSQAQAMGVDATVRTTLADGTVTGAVDLHADRLTARFNERRTDIDAVGLTGTAKGRLTLTPQDLDDIRTQLASYKTWIGDKLKTLGLSQDQFDQILNVSSRENLQSLLSSATPQKISDFANQLGISETQTRQLSQFLNTPSLQKAVDDMFRLTAALNENATVAGGANFSIGSLGWTQTDQASLLSLKNVTAGASLSSTNPDGQRAEASVTASAAAVTGEIGPDGQPRVSASTVEARTNASGNVYTTPGVPATPQKLREALSQNQLTAFYKGAVGQARAIEQRTGVPASVLMAGVVSAYRQTPRAQKANFDVAAALERQAQTLAQRYPQAVEAFKQSGSVQSFTSKAQGLNLPALTPALIKLAHERQTTSAEARVSSESVSNVGPAAGPGTFTAGQTTTVNGKEVSQTRLDGNFGALQMSEKPEILDAIGNTLQREFDNPPRKMQPFLASLGFNTDQIKALRTATPEQRRGMLNDPAMRSQLQPLIQSLNLGSFSVKGNNKALGENTSASLSTGAIDASGGKIAIRDVTAEIRNGKLVLNASASQINSNKVETAIGTLSVTAAGNAGRVSVNSDQLRVANGGRINGTVSGNADYRPNADTHLSGDFSLKLNNGVVKGTRVGNGQVETEMSARDLLVMTQHDPDAKAFIEGMQRQGIVINPNQKIKVRMSEVGLNAAGNNGKYSGTIEFPKINTSMGNTRLRLNVQGEFAGRDGSQDIHGNVVIKPDLNRLGASLNRLARQGLELNHTDSSVTAGPDAVRFDLSNLLAGGTATVRADGQNLNIKVDRAKILGLFDARDMASRKIIEALGGQGIRINPNTSELSIPVTALSAIMQDSLPAGMQIESLRLQNGELNGAFRYRR